MNIGINGIFLNFEKKNDGFGRYTFSLLIEFQNYKSHKFYVFVDRFFKFKELKKQFHSYNIIPIFIPFPTFTLITRKIWTFLLLPFFEYLFKINYFLCIDGVVSKWGYAKKIGTIHDLAFIKYPETILPKFYKFYNKRFSITTKVCKKIITVSNHSKSDIVDTYKISPQKIEVIYNGVSNNFFDELNEEDIINFKIKFKQYEPFIFNIGTLEPRKNIFSIIKVYEKLIKEGMKINLLIAGTKGWLNDKLDSSILNSKLNDSIVFLGNITDKEYRYLLSNCCLFIYIPLYEGFGLPVLEAMACGANIITSDNSSLPEIIQDAGILVNPLDIDTIVNKAKKVIKNKNHKKNDRAINLAKQFSWKKSAKKHIELFEDL